MASSIRTLSQLPSAVSSAITNDSYFEASVPVSISVDLSGNTIVPVLRYASRKISKKDLAAVFEDEIRENLKNDTGISSQDFGTMYEDYSKMISGDFTFDGTKTFLKNPIIAKDEITEGDFSSISTNYSVSLSALRRYVNVNASPTIGPHFGFVTQLTSNTDQEQNVYSLFRVDTANHRIENGPSYVFSPSIAKNISENEFVFKINPEERESNVWTSPASGIFTCYGWLDEINSSKASNENRWVALLGWQEDLRVWTTLQVQPFIPNNYISYVGFTFPVHKGMKLKIQTGFSVGSNSDKYFRSSSSLTNHLANAFLGGIYTGLSVDFDNLPTGNYTLCTEPWIYALCADLQNYKKHEESCDISTNNRIDELEERLATNEQVRALSDAINDRVKYIDTSTYTSKPIAIAIRMYNRMFDMDAPGGDPNYSQRCLNDQGEEAGNVPLQFCELTSLAARSFRDYYAPPTFTEKLESGDKGYVERAYTLRSNPPYGKVFSDGKYLFYCVSQDCTALVRIHGDFTSRGASAVAGYMLCPQTSTTNMNAVTIGKASEWMGNITDAIETISLPVKKGTIFMFYPWHTERREDSNGALQKAMKDYDPLARNAFLAVNVPAIVPNADGGTVYVKDLYKTDTNADRDTYTNSVQITSSKTISYNTYAVWTSYQSQRDKLVDPNGTGVGKFEFLFGSAKSHGPDASGTIATIVELP